MLDPQDELYDRRLATHLVSLYHQTQEEEEEEYLVSLQNIPQGGRTRIWKVMGCSSFHLGVLVN